MPTWCLNHRLSLKSQTICTSLLNVTFLTPKQRTCKINLKMPEVDENNKHEKYVLTSKIYWTPRYFTVTSSKNAEAWNETKTCFFITPSVGFSLPLSLPIHIIAPINLWFIHKLDVFKLNLICFDRSRDGRKLIFLLPAIIQRMIWELLMSF